MKATIKIFSLLLILLLLVAMTVTICAEEANVTATVIATNGPTYSVVVPTEISAGDLLRTPETSYYQKDFTISVPEVLFLDGKQIDVRVYGDDGVFALKNADGSSWLPYEVFSKADAQKALQSGDVFATFTEVGEANGFIRIDQKNITQADTYTGTLRFSFSVSDIEE